MAYIQGSDAHIKNLSRIQDHVGVKKAFNSLLEPEAFPRDFEGQETFLGDAYAVFPGYGALHGEDLLQNPYDALFDTVHVGAGSCRDIQVNVPVPGMPEAVNFDTVFPFKCGENGHEVRNGSDGHDDILRDVDGPALLDSKGDLPSDLPHLCALSGIRCHEYILRVAGHADLPDFLHFPLKGMNRTVDFDEEQGTH